MPSECWFPFPSPNHKTEHIPNNGPSCILGRKSHVQSDSRNECFQRKCVSFYLQHADTRILGSAFPQLQEWVQREQNGFPAGRHTERVGLSGRQTVPLGVGWGRGLQNSELGTAQQSPRGWQPMIVTKIIPSAEACLHFQSTFSSFIFIPLTMSMWDGCYRSHLTDRKWSQCKCIAHGMMGSQDPDTEWHFSLSSAGWPWTN